jgi:hypothetical protein
VLEQSLVGTSVELIEARGYEAKLGRGAVLGNSTSVRPVFRSFGSLSWKRQDTPEHVGLGNEYLDKKMDQQKRLDLLRSLRAEIVGLCAVKCRMSHERVVRDDASGLPVSCRFPEGNYQRIGLCAPELRAKRLGCSHTSARIKLDDAIKLLAMHRGEDEPCASALSSEAVQLDNAIHLLDHRKGEAEKRLAETQEEAHRIGGPRNMAEKMREAENELGEMEQLHSAYVERIGRLRDSVVNEIDKLLAGQALMKEE